MTLNVSPNSKPKTLAEKLAGGGTACPIPATHDRLSEVHHWWHEMAEWYHEPDPFRYRLGAFMQAARSVTFMLQTEKAVFESFDFYEKGWRAKAKADDILLWLKNTRNSSCHQQALVPSSWLRMECFRNPRRSPWDEEEERPFRVIDAFQCTHTFMNAFGQVTASGPSLADTLQFLNGAGDAMPVTQTAITSGAGIEFLDEDETSPAKGCSVAIAQQFSDGAFYSGKMSLSDIDPRSITLRAVTMHETDKDLVLELYFHSTNYGYKIMSRSCDGKQPCDTNLGIPSKDFGLAFERVGNYKDFAQRYGQALRHAVELCGGKPSAF